MLGDSRYLMPGFIVFTLLMGAIYIINQIADIETDRINNKLFILPKGLISVKSAYFESAFLIVVVLAFSSFFSPIYRLFLLLSLILGVLYSIKPFKFKSRPYLDLLSNTLGHGFLAFSIGWLSLKHFSIDTVIYSIPYAFAVGGVFLLCTVIDIKGDRETKERTIGVYLGEKWTTLLAIFFMIGAIISSIFVKDFICLTIAAISFLFFFWFYISIIKISRIIIPERESTNGRKERRFLLLSASIPVYLLTIICCIIYTWFLVFLIFLVLVTRLYYKKRFDVVYPKFLG